MDDVELPQEILDILQNRDCGPEQFQKFKDYMVTNTEIAVKLVRERRFMAWLRIHRGRINAWNEQNDRAAMAKKNAEIVP